MDVIGAINQRKSIRAFKPDPVSMDTLKKIIEPSLRAPSWANTQPWEFAIATGAKLAEIQQGFLAKGDEKPNAEVARPQEFPEPYAARIRALAPRNAPVTPPSKADMDSRRVQNFKHYGAPVCIYLLIGRNFYFQPKGINSWPVYDCGSVVQNIMLVATSYGLGTIAQAQAIVYPDVVRRVLGIPQDKLIALGIAIGYPDWDNPANQSRTARESVDKITTWHGF